MRHTLLLLLFLAMVSLQQAHKEDEEDDVVTPSHRTIAYPPPLASEDEEAADAEPISNPTQKAAQPANKTPPLQSIRTSPATPLPTSSSTGSNADLTFGTPQNSKASSAGLKFKIVIASPAKQRTSAVPVQPQVAATASVAPAQPQVLQVATVRQNIAPLPSQQSEAVVAVQSLQKAPESKLPESIKLSLNEPQTKPATPSVSDTPSLRVDAVKTQQPPAPQAKTEQKPNALPVAQNIPKVSPAKEKPGVISHIQRTMVDIVPAGSRIYSESSFSQKGNLKTITIRKFYIDDSGQKTYISEEITVQKIDLSIPQSNELEPTKKKDAPFYGFIDDPKTFNRYDELCQAIFEELNLARTQPKLYASFIQDQLNGFKDNYSFSYGPFTTASVEGKDAWTEAINYLNKQEPKQALRRVDCLDNAAAWFATDAANNLILGHIDSKGRAPPDRMKETCKIGSGGQNIAYGMMSARSAIMQLIVDDDVPDRGHRLNIYKDYTQVGLSCRQYPEYGTVTVNEFLY